MKLQILNPCIIIITNFLLLQRNEWERKIYSLFFRTSTVFSSLSYGIQSFVCKNIFKDIVANIKILGIMLISQLIKGSKEKIFIKPLDFYFLFLEDLFIYFLFIYFLFIYFLIYLFFFIFRRFLLNLKIFSLLPFIN